MTVWQHLSAQKIIDTGLCLLHFLENVAGNQIFTMQHYAGMIYAFAVVVVHLSASLSVTSRYYIEMTSFFRSILNSNTSKFV